MLKRAMHVRAVEELGFVNDFASARSFRAGIAKKKKDLNRDTARVA